MKTGISVIIPCLNEETSIAQVIQAAQTGIANLNVPGEVIVVDNGSTDGSVAAATQAGAQVVRERKIGYGAAIRHGFASARFSILVMADGDLTYDLTQMGDLVSPLLAGKADFAIGNRMNDIRPGAMPMMNRHVGNPLLTFFLRLLFGCKEIRDSQCGMRAIKRDAYLRLNCVTTGMEFATEMIVRALAIKLRIVEHDIIYHPRVGDSKLRPIRDGWRHIRFMLLCSTSLALMIPSATIWLGTMTAALVLAIGPVQIRSQQFDIHTQLLVGLFNLISLQILTGGMIAKAYAHLSGFRHDPVVAWLYEHLSFSMMARFSLTMLGLGLIGIIGAIVSIGPGHFNPANSSESFRLLFFCVLCILNGVQMAVANYLYSVMALPRHLDAIPRSARDTALQDL
jgi:glycosyltransferase involved in cell wall biosynthesis